MKRTNKLKIMFKKRKNFHVKILHPKLRVKYWELLQKHNQAKAKEKLVKMIKSEHLPRILQAGSLVSIGNKNVWLEIYSEDLIRIRSKLTFIYVDDLSNLPIDEVLNTKKDEKDE